MDKRVTTKSNIAHRRDQARLSGDSDYVERRNQLLKAAGAVFREKGFKGANVNDFAKAVGIDRASLYYYTSGKEELFQEIVKNAVTSNVAMAEEISGKAIAPEEKIREFVVRLMVSYAEHYPYLYVYVQEDMNQLDAKDGRWAREMRELQKRFEDAVVAIVDEGIRSGRLKSDGSAHLVAFGIIGMCNWSHRWFKPEGKMKSDKIGDIFADMVLDGLLGRS